MLKFKLLMKFFALMMLFVSGVSSSFAQYIQVSQQCWPTYSNYINCQQIGSEVKAPAIESCKQANEAWVSSGCAAQSQCMQNNGLPPTTPTEMIQGICPLLR